MRKLLTEFKVHAAPIPGHEDAANAIMAILWDRLVQRHTTFRRGPYKKDDKPAPAEAVTKD
jgi:hypothetical protein